MSLTSAISEIETGLIALSLAKTTDKSALREGTLSEASNSSGKFDNSFIVAVDSVQPIPEMRLHEQWHIADLRIEIGGHIGKNGRSAKSIELHTFSAKIREKLTLKGGVGNNVKGILFDGQSFYKVDDDKRLILQMSFKLYYYEDVT